MAVWLRIKAYSKAIISAIEEGRVTTKKGLNDYKLRMGGVFSMPALPTNPDILARAKNPSKKLISLLSIKPVRTLSGIAVVAVMVKPHKCPGECIYCPSGIGRKTPKSYTGREPAALRALMFNFSPYRQAMNRIGQLQATGHKTDKIELIVMGGTFLSMPAAYQNHFVKGCIDAVIGRRTGSLREAKTLAENSARRLAGVCYETRPDFCRKQHINRILSLAGTRVELGVQAIDDATYKIINRTHTVRDVVSATARLRDSALKAGYHIMPGLPGQDRDKDLADFRELFSNPDFRPDTLKFYPCMVMDGTELHSMWKRGEYSPLSTEEAAELVAEMKRHVPKYCRVMRVQRDVPSNLIAAGVKKSNLRQIVAEKMREKGVRCRCIRCREAGLSSYKTKKSPDLGKVRVLREEYEASNGTEIFISAEDRANDMLLGFCRLRIPHMPFRKEITAKTALVRELHVYGEALPLHGHSADSFQHMGFGKKLLCEAEKIALEEFCMRRIAVMSALGVRQYYRDNFAYRNSGPYVSKPL